VQEYLAAMNTASSMEDLLQLHDELKDSMTAMAFSAPQVKVLREAFAERADELEPPTAAEVAEGKLSSGIISQIEYDHIIKIEAMIKSEVEENDTVAAVFAAVSTGMPGDLEPVYRAIYEPAPNTSLSKGTAGPAALARCAFSDRNLHSRMPLDPPLVCLQRTCVWPMAFLSGVHFSYQFTL
jgi:hypothetical protein